VGHEKRATLFWTITSMLLDEFFYGPQCITSVSMQEHQDATRSAISCTEVLQHPWYKSGLNDKRLNTSNSIQLLLFIFNNGLYVSYDLIKTNC